MPRFGHSLPKEKLGGIGMPSWLPDWLTGKDVREIQGPVYIPPRGKAGGHRKELAADIARQISDDPHTQRNIYSGVQAAADFIPLIGEDVGVRETGEYWKKGDYINAIAGGLGTVLGIAPVVGDVGGKLIKEGGKKLARGLGEAASAKVADEGAKGLGARVYHGSRSGLPPEIEAGKPFYTTAEKPMAEGYAQEAVLSGAAKEPLIAEYDLDPSGYMSRDDYRKLLEEHFPEDAWIGEFPSEAATLEHPAILEALRKQGVKGVAGLWDFGMDPMLERQVHVTLDPTTLKSPASNTEIPVSSVVDTVAPQGLGIRAYHGSPHSFEEFDISKIGTGEGAQAYGHGLYFAENEAVAKSYRDALTDRVSNSSTPQGAVERALGLNDSPEDARKWLEGQRRTVQRTLDRNLGGPMDDYAREQAATYDEALQLLDKGYKPGGSMYEVDIAADPEAFLDWDKPLSEQPEGVKAALKAKMDKLQQRGDIMMPSYVEQYEKGTLTGPQVYSGIGGQAEQSTEALKHAGIPGIRYLDQGSRAGGIGSRNYVVFDPKIIKIVRMYGIGGALGLGLISQQEADQLRAQMPGEER